MSLVTSFLVITLNIFHFYHLYRNFYIDTSTVGDTVEVMSADKARQLPILAVIKLYSPGSGAVVTLPSSQPGAAGKRPPVSV